MFFPKNWFYYFGRNFAFFVSPVSLPGHIQCPGSSNIEKSLIFFIIIPNSMKQFLQFTCFHLFLQVFMIYIFNISSYNYVFKYILTLFTFKIELLCSVDLLDKQLHYGGNSGLSIDSKTFGVTKTPFCKQIYIQ